MARFGLDASYSAVQGELCSLASHLGLQVCYFVYLSCLYSFSPWTEVSPSIEGFLSAPSRVLSPLDRSSCLLHQRPLVLLHMHISKTSPDAKWSHIWLLAMPELIGGGLLRN